MAMSEKDGKAPISTLVSKDFIADLRGGYPAVCDFCETPTPPEQLEPEEAGAWVCHACLKRWDEHDKAMAQRRQRGE
jgi:hypothetical protein